MAKSLLGTYLHFLRSPNLNDPPTAVSTPTAAKSILRLYSVHLVLLLVVLVFVSLVPNAQESNNLLDSVEGMPVWYLPFAAVIVAPLLEETAFRLPLRPTLFNLLPLIAIIFVAINAFSTLSAPLLPALLVAVLLALFFGLQGSRIRILQSFYNRFALIIFYAVALLFGAVHIGNYDSGVWPFLPILVLPQVIIGLLLGFVRLRYGFVWGILLHAFHNGILLLPVFLIQIFGSEQLQASINESPDLETLSRLDQIIMGAVSIYTMGGVVLGGVFAWKVFREWKGHKAEL